MEFCIIGIVVISVALASVLLWNKKQNNQIQKNTVDEQYNISVLNSNEMKNKIIKQMIQLGELPAEVISNESKLIEITDSKILAHINNLVPELFQVGNTIGNAIQAIQTNAQVLYQAIIPARAELANSKEMQDAVRGFYHGANGIKGNANFLKVQQNANVHANVAGSVMGMASMVVGQYYMTQINAELGEINERLIKILDFQDSEYKSKVFALVAQIQKIAQFQVDILGNEELRLSEIYNLNRWEKECAQLLGQANLTLAGFTKDSDFDYNEYEKQIESIQNWVIYQKTLIEVMLTIAKLKHSLYLGSVSRAQCDAFLPLYSKQVNDVLIQLELWHNTQICKFKLNIDKRNRKRVGVDRVIHGIPALFNEEEKYRKISDKTVSKIIAQSNKYEAPQKLTSTDLFQEEVKIIVKEGKIYYLLDSVVKQI